ncbi:MAG: 2-dehydro-3-deoxygluconokinase [Candidatus Aminicenantes bacterium]|nr:2-dehydro-3-deoxygluconokinase [Candidatus Aminicenantes bacterium]
MANIATFGEIMLRLSPPAKELLFQSPRLEAVFGGGEANVAVSLAILGHRSRWISVVPSNPVGDAALRELRRHGVDVGAVVRGGRRLGIYFAETGANERPSRVLYDRDGSGLAEAGPGAIDWQAALDGMDRFHVTGITPALSATAAALTLEAVKAARSKGMKVSLDLNYRSKLWRYGRPAPEVMRDIAAHADTLIGNEEDCHKALGIGPAVNVAAGRLDLEAYERLTAQVMAAFPKLERVAITLRESLSADWNRWSAVLRTGAGFLAGPAYEIRAIVDRIGTGDAFAAGLVHGLAAGLPDAAALDFAVAAAVLKHSIPGDWNLSTEKDILALAGGDRSGRVQR